MQILNQPLDVLVFENAHIRREITFRHGRPIASVITRTASGFPWKAGKNCDTPVLDLPGFDWSMVETTYEDGIVTFYSNYIVRWVFTVSENTPAIRSQLFARALPEEETGVSTDIDCAEETSPAPDIIDRIYHDGHHIKLTAVRFLDRTACTSSYVRTEEAYLSHAEEAFSGHIICLTDQTRGEVCMIRKEAPSGAAHLNRGRDDLRASTECFSVLSSGIDYTELSPSAFTAGYPVTVALCRTGEEAHIIRCVDAEDCGGFSTLIAAITPEDQCANAAVCEETVSSQILCAAALGMDIVEIGRGWQSHGTDSAQSIPDPTRFPDGFGPLCRLAYAHGVALSLRYSPNASNDYANWQHDAGVLLEFFRACGIRHFRLSDILIRTKAGEKNFLRMCIRLMVESEGRIALQMDITDGMTPGWFYEKELGTLYVEERSTASGEYFPHRTLRSLWQSAAYIPAQRMLYGIPDLRQNADAYLLSDNAPDPLAPAGYSADYAFASVMAANPVLLCNLQTLEEEDSRALAGIIAEYKRHRDDFEEIIPCGECPSGYSLTGFHIRGRLHDYYIGLRELSDADTVRIPVDRILYTNDEELITDGDAVRFSSTRRYFFAQLRKSVL